MKPKCPICLCQFDEHKVVATPCGHVFHDECLAGPCEDEGLCPVCEVDIVESRFLELHFFTGYNAYGSSNNISSLSFKLKEREAEISSLEKKINQLKTQYLGVRKLYRSVQQKYFDERDSLLLKQRHVDKLKAEVKDLSSRHANFAHAVNQFAETNVSRIIRGTFQEAGEALHEKGLLAYRVGDDIARNMGMLCYVLKYEFDELRVQNDQYLQQLIHKDTQLLELLQNVVELQIQLRNNNQRNRDVGF